VDFVSVGSGVREWWRANGSVGISFSWLIHVSQYVYILQTAKNSNARYRLHRHLIVYLVLGVYVPFVFSSAQTVHAILTGLIFVLYLIRLTSSIKHGTSRYSRHYIRHRLYRRRDCRNHLGTYERPGKREME
jgi:hypothetical protein